MILIPFEYLKSQLFLPLSSPSEIAEKLTYFGLETQLVKKRNQFYLEINPLPNRADLFCWWGIVQEIKVLLNCSEKLFNLVNLRQSKKKLFSVSITTPYCSAFSLGLIRNFKIKTSPLWLKEWLEVNQIPSINNLIDIANLIRLETGQSWRFYDYDILEKKKKIVVGKVGQKETIRLFSKKEMNLFPEDLVVRTDREIISLAGIAESEKFGWTTQTKNILIEGAFFNPLQLKRTSQRLKISCPSNSFFSFSEVLPKIVSLLRENQDDNLKSEIVFTYQNFSPKPHLVKVSQLFLEKKTGQSLPSYQIEKIWKSLNFSYSKKGKNYHVKVPFYRLDLKLPEDLLEELLRIYDYNQVVSSLL